MLILSPVLQYRVGSLKCVIIKIRRANMIQIPENEIKFKFARSSGPGGQNVNKRETKAQGFWNPKESRTVAEKLSPEEQEQLFENLEKEEISVVSQEYRTQERNRFAVVEKINEIINQALKKEKKRYLTKPSRSAKQRRLEEKRRKSEIKKARQKIKYF